MTHRIGDNPINAKALEDAKSAINRANRQFRRVIDGVLVTEDEYIQWRDNGGASGSK
jgi:hypothetical protein